MAKDVEIDEDKPLDPEVEYIRRRMMRLLAISFGSMLLGLLVVFGAILYKVDQPTEEEPSDLVASPIVDNRALKGGEVALPAGARLISSSLNANRILLTVELAGGDLQLQVLDMTTARILAVYNFSNK